ncbi:hypothetical protein PMIN04_000305 [Paraphaeosphaeria minitans]
MPDHEGPTASFAMGITEGHANLDSVRAVLSSGLLNRVRHVGIFRRFGSLRMGVRTARIDLRTRVCFLGLYLGFTSLDGQACGYLISRLKKSGPYNLTAFLTDLHLIVTQAFATYANPDLYNYFINGRADLHTPILTSGDHLRNYSKGSYLNWKQACFT